MRCTIVRSQSRSLSFPQRGSRSCATTKVAKAGLYDIALAVEIWVIEVGGVVREASAEIVVGNEVMKGV